MVILVAALSSWRIINFFLQTRVDSAAQYGYATNFEVAF